MQLTNPAAAPFRPLTGGEAIRLLARGMDLARHRPPPGPPDPGSKVLRRALNAVNTLGTAGYWLIGRRCRRAHPS